MVLLNYTVKIHNVKYLI